MATTNFGNLNTNQLTAWGREAWKVARNNSFTMQFAGSTANSVVHRISELTKSDKGTRAVYHLITDLTGDGVVGDYTLEGNEEAINAYDQVIQIDQMRNANRSAGRLADQKVVVNFRKTSRDVLGYWLADRIDQLAFLTASGVAYTFKNNGGTRPVLAAGQNFSDLEFAGDVTAPTANRHQNWTATGLAAGNTAADNLVVPSYKMMVEAKAYFKDHYMRGIKSGANGELIHVFMTPSGLAQLKLDSDFLANVRNAGVRGDSNPLFSGSMIMQDGMVIHEFRHVFNTLGAAGGSKWGSTGNTDGQAVLFMGAQALAMADIGDPYWVEDTFDFSNQHGISIGKMLGFKKSVFYSTADGGNADYNILRVNTAL